MPEHMGSQELQIKRQWPWVESSWAIRIGYTINGYWNEIELEAYLNSSMLNFIPQCYTEKDTISGVPIVTYDSS